MSALSILPADVGGTVHGLGRQGRGREEIGHAIVKPLSILGRAKPPVRLAGLILGVHRLAEKNLVAIRRRSEYHVALHDPAGYGLSFVLIFVDRIFDIGTWITEQCFHVQPFFRSV